MVRKCRRKLLHDRRTVVLSLPADVQDAELATNSGPLELPPAFGRPHPDPEAVGRLADGMARAQRVLIVGGRGAVLADAEQVLLALADRTGALLATTVCGHGLFANSPWSLGICGGFASPIADELIAESDLVAGFGANNPGAILTCASRGSLASPPLAERGRKQLDTRSDGSR